MPRGEFDRSARRAQTRARLLEAAAEVYSRRGFAGATLEEVAAEAGFSKGAVYGHFGSKENLLLALVEEHLAGQVTEQLALFDRDRATWERPLAGSERWMERLHERPERFRLFVELWVYAQRDERLRRRLADALAALRATFAHFAATSSADAGFTNAGEASAQCASIMLGLGIGLSMLELGEPGTIPAGLLGTTLSVLIRALESSTQAQQAFGRLAGAEVEPPQALMQSLSRPEDLAS
ncbi:MAG TPA: TetR/AcrR family transcriptional regulator [Solirubrobacteraceae bacterium]|nr:TetR/AcrR family transcriptional regulator [Solirubrobacteraceae bacterium]